MTGEDNSGGNTNTNNGISTNDNTKNGNAEAAAATDDDHQQQQQSHSIRRATTASSSPTSVYLARIKEETDRLRQKRAKHHQYTINLERSQKERRRQNYQTNKEVEAVVAVVKGTLSSKEAAAEKEEDTTRTTLKAKEREVDNDDNDDDTNHEITTGLSWNDILHSSYRSEEGEEESNRRVEQKTTVIKSVTGRTPLASSSENKSKKEEAREPSTSHHNFVATHYLLDGPSSKEQAALPAHTTTEDPKEHIDNTTTTATRSSFFRPIEFIRTVKKINPKNHTHNKTMSSLTTKYSAATATPEQKKEHEAFCTKLIDEVLGKGGAGDGKIPMDKVMMIIWQFRDDKDVIKFMTRFVSKNATQRDVFDGIEFYLPQLAHMIIHLETEIDDPILEQFSLVIAQQSIHFALQLNWILAGAIEDYQPETPDGEPNPTHNPLYYSRCIKLLTNIERVVVYRRPRSQELQQLYEKGSITKAEMDTLERADRRFTAMQITSPENKNDEGENFGGNLMYKRAVRSSCFKFKRWKTRYFAIEERMLNCYNTEGGTLRRSMPIDGATVELMEKTKYPNMFRVTNLNFAFRIRASSAEDRNKWMKMLEVEASTGRVFGHTDGSLFSDENKDAQRVLDELTPSQLARYHFYRRERDFVRRLTDIAEDLRFLERPDRKKQAPGMMEVLDIPESVYSPLMGSTDIFRRIHSSVWKETKVFNTKARCPTVMNFLGVRGEMEFRGMKDVNIDLAEYMHIKFNREISGYSSTDNLSALSSLLEVSTTTQEDGMEVITVEMDANSDIGSSKETLVVKKTVSSISEDIETEGDEKGGKPSAVWSGSSSEHRDESTPKSTKSLSTSAKQSGTGNPSNPRRGNNQLRRFLRESMVVIPRRLVHHLERQTSVKESANIFESTSIKRIPIMTGSSNKEKPKDVYIGRSSVMGGGKTTLGKSYKGNLDEESIERAKNIVCGGETWAEQSARMLQEYDNKPEGGDMQLEIVRFISKSNDDLRQEVFVMQMIHYYKSVFIDAGLPLWLKTYKLLSTSATTGLIEFNDDTNSLDGLKKADGYPKEGGMRKYFENTYGDPTTRSFKAAQRNFMESLAAYSILCYLLGLKDRHNGNIMIDMYGHLVHIDFGFAMGMNVGHEFTMERAPFKLTAEYVEVMGGANDACYKEFVRLFVEGFKAARKNSQIAVGMVEIMMYKSNLPCFSGWRYGGGQALRGFRERLCLNVPDDAVEKTVKALIDKSRDHLGTKAYDAFQLKTNGIAP